MVALSISRWRSMQNFAPDGRNLTILHGPVESRLRLCDRLLASLTFLAAAASSRRRSTSRRFGSLFSSATAVRAALSLIVGAVRFFGLSPRSRPASS
ncbi:hypothetical protein CQ10_37360 [Bradyrhizobium valentinum]|nr:hypothetical protein CQ10_37360 [Bradyrhizobium valentinum]